MLQLLSVQQRKMAFHTYSLHVIMISITCGNCIFISVKPSAKKSAAIRKGMSVLTTSITPVQNHFTYILINK